MSMRRAGARLDGVQDLMDEVRSYERSRTLTETQRVILRLHDAFLVDPAGLTDDVRDQVLAHLSTAQIVELAMKFIQWSSNRPNVALAEDAPHDSNHLTAFHYSESGEYIPHDREWV